MTETFVCDFARTPFGRYGGALAAMRADDLAAVPRQALRTRDPNVCETASQFDPASPRYFNILPRRSAFGPHGE